MHGHRKGISPEIRYHYQPLGSAEMIERLEHTLLRHQIYFSSPSSFNDPFDCKVWPSFDGSPEQKREYIARVARMKYGADTEVARQQIEVALADPEYFEKAYLNFLRTDIPTLGVYCLTERPDDIVMWPHYAGSHSGICLGFAANYIFPDCTVERVNYPESNKYPNVNFFTASKEEQTNAVLLTKATHWGYEREWRVVDPGGPGLHDIHPEWLVGVILDCQNSQTEIAEVERIVSKREPRLQVLRGTPKLREFALSIEKI
jgi:hypothetical protein